MEKNSLTNSTCSVWSSVRPNTTTSTFNSYGTPYLVETLVFPDRIELVFRQDPNIAYFTWSPRIPSIRIFKKIYKAEFLKEVEGYYEGPREEQFIFEE